MSDGPPTSLSSFGCDAGLFVATTGVGGGASRTYQTTEAGVRQVGQRLNRPGQGPAAAVLAAACGGRGQSFLLLNEQLTVSVDADDVLSDQCGLWVTLRDYKFNQVGTRACVLPPKQTFDLSNVSVAAAAVEDEANASATSVSAVVLIGADQVVYSAVVHFSMTGEVLSTRMARRFDVGSSPSVTVARATDGRVANAVVFAAVVEGVYCFNTEVRNKEPGTASCDQVPVAQGAGVSYAVGTLDQWLNELDALPPSATLSSCSNHLLHGTITQGHTPR